MSEENEGKFTRVWETIKTFVEVNAILGEAGLPVAVVVGVVASEIGRTLPLFKGMPTWAVVTICVSVPSAIVLALLWISMSIALRRYRSAEDSFISLARANMAVDVNLFEELFVKPTQQMLSVDNFDKFDPNKSESLISSINDSIALAGENIQFIIERLKEIMTNYTGKPCSTCIKFVASASREQVKTVRRDATSAAVRGAHIDQDVKGNTAYVWIMWEKNEYFASNNLKALSRRGKYKNPRRGWENFYNSSIVFPIFNPTEPNSELGFLCVDSLKGKLDRPAPIHYARELCGRLSVMVYRLSVLEQQRLAYESRRKDWRSANGQV